MMIYVYQVSDTEYGAGINYESCKLKGVIVEQWPLNTPEQAAFVARRGSAFNGVSPKVTSIADAARRLMIEDETFLNEINRPIAVEAEAGRPEPNIWQRIAVWLGLKSVTA